MAKVLIHLVVIGMHPKEVCSGGTFRRGWPSRNSVRLSSVTRRRPFITVAMAHCIFSCGPRKSKLPQSSPLSCRVEVDCAAIKSRFPDQGQDFDSPLSAAEIPISE